MDFMIDQQFRVWLIEVNTNPCLETTSPILQKIIPQMIDNAFK
jgi:tubulin polyglutamylase TTLL1/tubulin monoglycylase TTLL3/8